jgi:hypothetical protein
VLNDCSFLQCSWGRGTFKFISLKRLVQDNVPDFIMIQEIMCDSVKAFDSFHSWLKYWSFSTIDYVGLSVGLVSTWSP